MKTKAHRILEVYECYRIGYAGWLVRIFSSCSGSFLQKVSMVLKHSVCSLIHGRVYPVICFVFFADRAEFLKLSSLFH